MRLLRHLFAPSPKRWFADDRLRTIAERIAADEARHRGEICFAVESALPALAVWRGVDSRSRALQVFADLRVWDTRDNNGVLIYLLLADRRIEIVADRGLDGLVSAEQWRGICGLIEERLRAGDPEAAIVAGVAAAGDLLAEHFPRDAAADAHGMDRNELPDAPVVLG
jgi:uncharacterized membrane protein